ncbi:nucleotidyl transferase AbiEii/AbiGii toxin family protein [candidate division WOR-3 bacterium]|nr:nucleotidyl transferase AbiEii/AbiGii toxin family protein [candidate division WOR-3 bacterium]
MEIKVKNSSTMKKKFFKQARLMLQSLPYVFEEKVFALKGGSAINFFFRNMPRLSVDIDLTYLPVESRDISLVKIESSLSRIAENIERRIPGISIQKGHITDPNMTNKIFIRQTDVQIKIEPNLVNRGTVFPVEKHILCKKAQNIFELSFEAITASFADIFGGKICAALDRQHPRDFYDIKQLLNLEGITEQIRKAFIVNLISHNRPIHELLDPVFSEFNNVFEGEFQGMTEDDVSYEDLVEVRRSLLHIIRRSLTENEKDFLLTFKKGEPNWNLSGIDVIEKLPAVQWKLANIRRMNKEKKTELLSKLRNVLSK